MPPATRRSVLRSAPAALLAAGGVSTAASVASTPGAQESAATPAVQGGSRPAMFVHLDTLRAVRARIDAGDEPWATAYEEFRADVGQFVDADPDSVTDHGGHRFQSSSPSDSEERSDYLAAIRTGDRIRDLGLAYHLSGDDAYARAAVDLLHHWFLDEETRMTPERTDAIELYITLPKMWYGAELVRGHPAWERDGVGPEDALAGWVRSFLTFGHDVPTDFGQQNIFNWQELTHAAGAVYLRDWDRLAEALRHQRETGFDQLRRDGLLENELQRSTSLTYSVYAAKALLTTAEISRLYPDRYDGPSLYEYRKFDHDDRVALERICDAHVPYLLEPELWSDLCGGDDCERFQLAYGFPARSQEKAGAAYELAYSYYQKPGYLAVVEAANREVENVPTYAQVHQDAIEDDGRPRRDERILGWTTLTHGERFRLDTGDDEGETDGEDGTGNETTGDGTETDGTDGNETDGDGTDEGEDGDEAGGNETTGDGTGGDTGDDGTDTDGRPFDDGQPGPGIVGTLASLGGASYLLRRRFDDEDEETERP